MRTEPGPYACEPDQQTVNDDRTTRREYLAVALAAAVGLGLLVDSLGRSSATYDEVFYLGVAARWWRTGDQDAIARMGSPLTFWKVQQAPVFWALDRSGRGAWVDDPVAHQREILPLVRTWSLTIWLSALLLTSAWGRRLYGPRAMVLAAWLFALSPNLLAHGALATMELPLLACTTAIFYLFWHFLQTGSRRAFWASAALGGLAWSCKYTTVLVPPILASIWWVDRWRHGESGVVRLTVRVAWGMLGFLLALVAANLVITGFAMLPISAHSGDHPFFGRFGPAPRRWIAHAIETPIPQDWAGFATQVIHQHNGGPSYLFGQRRQHGWWYYYLVALAVKVPLTFWLLVGARIGLGRHIRTSGRAGMLPAIMAMFLTITSVGSSRNYGLRYLLPLFPLAIVWVSGLAEGGHWARRIAAAGLVGQALAVASVHPFELSYFNALAGGPVGGRRILSDSNLDWGQGLKTLARLQREHPEFRDLTLYYFGHSDPSHYGVVGDSYQVDATDDHPGMPATLTARTRYLAVSASLQWGPWGPEGYFRSLDGVAPVRLTDDATIAIYRVLDLSAGLEPH